MDSATTQNNHPQYKLGEGKGLSTAVEKRNHATCTSQCLVEDRNAECLKYLMHISGDHHELCGLLHVDCCRRNGSPLLAWIPERT
jgi:hypothetical protein